MNRQVPKSSCCPPKRGVPPLPVAARFLGGNVSRTHLGDKGTQISVPPAAVPTPPNYAASFWVQHACIF